MVNTVCLYFLFFYVRLFTCKLVLNEHDVEPIFKDCFLGQTQIEQALPATYLWIQSITCDPIEEANSELTIKVMSEFTPFV